MSEVSDDGHAFPFNPVRHLPGMSLRDWFAGQAIAGMAARDTFDSGQDTPQKRAKLAYVEADAMLAERYKAECR